MRGYAIAPRELRTRQPAQRSSHGFTNSEEAMGFGGTRRRINPNDAIELSKVSMTNVSGAGAETPFVNTLIKTPGHAPADTLASAPILNQIELLGGVAQVTQQLMETRRSDPKAQLFPESTVSIIGQDHMRAGEPKLAVEIFNLNLLAYPESADAHTNLADAYLADGQKDLARQHAEKALTSWILIPYQRHRGPIRSRTAVRFVTARRMYSRN